MKADQPDQVQEPEYTDFNSIFNGVVMGQEVRLHFGARADYDSLRTSLLRRFKGYKSLMEVMDMPDSFIKASCKKLESGGYAASFKMEPVEAKSNLPKKLYQVLKDL